MEVKNVKYWFELVLWLPRPISTASIEPAIPSVQFWDAAGHLLLHYLPITLLLPEATLVPPVMMSLLIPTGEPCSSSL